MLLAASGSCSDGRPTWAVLKAFVLVRRSLDEHPGLGAHFFYFFYAWTNIALKYEGLREEDFALHSVERDFDVARLAPVEPTVESLSSQVKDGIKVETQARFTNRALKRLFEQRQASARGRA
jgi:hypothetical protein